MRCRQSYETYDAKGGYDQRCNKSGKHDVYLYHFFGIYSKGFSDLGAFHNGIHVPSIKHKVNERR